MLAAHLCFIMYSLILQLTSMLMAVPKMKNTQFSFTLSDRSKKKLAHIAALNEKTMSAQLNSWVDDTWLTWWGSDIDPYTAISHHGGNRYQLVRRADGTQVRRGI